MKENGIYQFQYSPGIIICVLLALSWLAFPYCILCNKDILTKNEWIILRPNCYIKIPLMELEIILKNDLGIKNSYIEIAQGAVYFNIRERRIKIDCFQPGACNFIYKLFQSANVPLPKNFINFEIPKLNCTVGEYYNIVQDDLNENLTVKPKAKKNKRKKQ